MNARLLRRAWACAAVSGLLAGSLAARALSLQGAKSEASPARASTIVVFPFEDIGKAGELDWLEEGLAELARTRLVGHGPAVFTRAERLAALEKLGLPSYAHFSRATMLKIAAEIDADYVVFGEFAAQDKTVRVTERVLSVNPARLSAPLAETGSLDALADLQGRLAWRALCEVQAGASPGAACGTASPAAQQFLQNATPLRADAFEFYIRGVMSAEDEARLRDLREASRLAPDWEEPIFATARTYYARRDCEAALQWYARITPLSVHAQQAGFDSGVCRLLRNDPIGAEASFSALAGTTAPAAGATDTAEPEVLNNLGAALLREARYKDALVEFARAQRLDPGEPDYWFNIGLAQYLGADWDAAPQALQEALRLQPDDTQAKSLLAVALDRSGQDDEAKALRAELATDSGAKKDPTKMDATTIGRMVRAKMELNVGAER
ncbi:MAG: hypothetical protein ACRD5L_14245 [Bryobacteraceae bacterium]